MIETISNVADIHLLFDVTEKSITDSVPHLTERLKNEIDTIVELRGVRTFENTIKTFDTVIKHYAIPSCVFEVLTYLSPNAEIRSAASNASIHLRQYYIDSIEQNIPLYHALKDYINENATQENLTQSQRYCIENLTKSFKRLGLDLPEEKRHALANLKKDLAQLTTDFEQAISDDKSTLYVSLADLAGLKQDFIDQLKKTDDGLYILGLDYPTYFTVMEQCSVSKTRKNLSTLFGNRAHPHNTVLLESIIAKRDELAHLVGYESYAAYDIDEQMAQSVSRVQDFITNLLQKATVKEEQEFNEIKKHLPESIELAPDGSMYSWDKAYVKNSIKKKLYDIDEQEIAEYFPMEHTIEGLFAIYQQFFSLEFKQQPISLWASDLTLVQVYDTKTQKLLGYLILDLYPRANKFSHACQMGVIPAIIGGSPALGVVVANFTKSTDTKPSLLTRSEVNTFFHEFGHALHFVLGRTELAMDAGTNVKMDFVEMPSQMLESWLLDKEILQQLSHHYITGKQLSDNHIDRILSLKNFGSGDHIQRQLLYAQLALDYYKAGAQKDTTKIVHSLSKTMRKHVYFDEDQHIQASFNHLMGYGAKYYGYLWSMVYALDLFDYIKQHGLLNPEIGKRYRDMVLSKGGSEDPNLLLKDFLGREPNQEAFLKDLGL